MLTIEEFRLLPDDEKAERYKELSDHDRFIWRISSPLSVKAVTNKGLSKEQRESVRESRLKLLKEGKITQQQFDELEKD